MKTKRIFLALSAIFLFCIFSGCADKMAYRTGFEFENHRQNSIMSAVESDRIELPVNDVRLNFFYGQAAAPGKISDENFKRICFAVYFCNSKNHNDMISTSTVSRFVDYKEIPGFFFMKEISEDDFLSDQYAATMKRFREKKFKHSEEFLVPPDVIKKPKGSFNLEILEIYLSQNSNDYCLGAMEFISVYYEFTDDSTIRLIKR